MGQSAKITLVPKNTSSNKKTEDQKMCHPSQSSPNQIHAWRGVYPDLNAFNDLFSPTSPPPNPQYPSPWISFLGFLGLQPIPQEQRQLLRNSLLHLQQLSRNLLLRHLHLLDRMSTARHLHLLDRMSTASQPIQGTKQAAPSRHQVHTDVTKEQTSQDALLNPAASPATPPTSSSCSKQSPLASSTSPPSPP